MIGVAVRPDAAGGAWGPSCLPPASPDDAHDDRISWRQVVRNTTVLVLLPLLGALLAYRLTTPPGPGPVGFVRIAEAPPAEVAGVRAVDDPLGLGALAGLRAPVGAAAGDPALEARTALPRPGEPGGSLATGDGILIRVPGDAARGAWPATVGLTPTGILAPAPTALQNAEAVLGAIDQSGASGEAASAGPSSRTAGTSGTSLGDVPAPGSPPVAIPAPPPPG